MPQYKAPGVYVEEVERGAKPIAGVGTSTAGFLGETERGPEEPRLLTSYADYQRIFGGPVENRFLAQAVDGFFQNGGSRCFVGRVTAATTLANATLSPHSPTAGTLGPDASPLDFGRVAAGTDRTRTVVVRNRGQKGDDELTITDLEVTGSNKDDFEVATDVPQAGITLAPGETTGIDVTFTLGPNQSGEKSATLELSLDGSGTAENVPLQGTVVATGDGTLGTSTGTLHFGSFAVENERTATVTVNNLGGTTVTLTGATFEGPDSDAFSDPADIGANNVVIEAGGSADVEIAYAPSDIGEPEATLKLAYSSSNSPLEFDLVADATESIIELEAVGPGDWGEGIAVTVGDGSLFAPAENDLFSLTVRYWRDPADRAVAAAVLADPETGNDEVPAPDVEETYDNLSTDEASGDYYATRLGGNSTLIGVNEENSESGRRPANGTVWFGEEFSDAAVEPSHYDGNPNAKPEDRTGLAAFERIDEISIVCIPDENEYNNPLAEKLVTHCTMQGDRFAILQSPEQAGRPGDLEPSRRSDFAAFYYPWLTVAHPETGRDQTVPPGGHVAGIYARSDQEHGVHKAPANEQVRGIRGLQLDISKGDQAILNPRGVNCIRTFRGRGTRVWGARTTSSDPAWKYVNVRRLFLFVEESIDEGTQWVVFESNNEQLWARVRQTIRNFLTSVWQDGALMGTTPEEAFYVKCDRSTMTQNDIDNGRLICEIGIAPVKPAEFVVFRISQTTAGGE